VNWAFDLEFLAALAVGVTAVWLELRSRQRLLERTGSTRRPRTLGALSVPPFRGLPARLASILAGVALGFVIARLPGGVAGGALGWAMPRALRRRTERRHEELLESQLPERVAGIAAALRAGLSLSQAIRFASDEGDPPAATELRGVVDRESLGVPLDQSIERWSAEEGGSDVRFVASVLQLHHRVGGDAPAVLEQVVRSLRQRRAAAREVRSLTAQARLSGSILGLLPVGFFLFLTVLSRSDISAAYSSPIGLGAIVAGLALDGGACLWIRHLLRVSL
jgi:tight adherence protein B